MTAFKVRREALLRAHWINLDGYGEEDTAEPVGIPALTHEERVARYAARIAAGLPLHPGQRLGARIRAELADTDPDAVTPPPATRRGRPSLASRTRLPFAARLNRDCRLLAMRLAKRSHGVSVPVPAVVAEQFPAEPDLARQWGEHVRSLARRWRSRVAHSGRTNQGR